MPEGGAITGWAGCRWWGAGYFDGLGNDGREELPVPLALGAAHDLRDRQGVRISRDRLPDDDICVRHDVRCTRPERSLFDAMRWSGDLREAVVALDMMAAAELTSVRRMRGYCGDHGHWNGLPRVVEALDLASERSMSPNETRVRLTWVLDAHLPPPLVNQPVFDLRGTLLGIADLLDPFAGVVGEYDGAAHREADRHRRDVRREDLFRRAGLEYFKVVGLDLLDTDLMVERMLAARARARFAAPHERAWTLNPPRGWDESPLDAAGLDERLEYRDWLAS